MRIAQVAPLTESVPPKTYGGIERVVHYLTEELVRRGHDVTLFASGDSSTSADHVAVIRQSSRNGDQPYDPAIRQLCQAMEVARMANHFDIVHFHTDYLHFPIWRDVPTPLVTTLHGRLDLPDLKLMFREFSEMPVVSISDAQRKPLPEANWAGTVYNGTPAANYTFQPNAGDCFAFLGRFCPDKGPVDAIKIAKRVGVPLKMAAKIDDADRHFFATEVEPHLSDPLIQYVGEVNEQEKNVLLGGALALLFPIAWPEPFGLVMTEAMACGTPTIAYRNGSVDEVMRDGVTGFVVENVDQAVAAVERLPQIDRRQCRQHFDDNFSLRQMTDGYLRVYEQLIRAASGADSPATIFLEPSESVL